VTKKTETQQIRLGLGQVLDYAAQVRAHGRHARVRPILVLEKAPTESRWTDAAREAGITLTWAPTFPGLSGDGTVTASETKTSEAEPR
jgi:hypothetical protein